MCYYSSASNLDEYSLELIEAERRINALVN